MHAPHDNALISAIKSVIDSFLDSLYFYGHLVIS